MKPLNSIGSIAKFATLTDEQIACVESDAQTMLVVAAAGSGKTTMLMAYAAARKSARGLYIAFSRAVADEANLKLKALGLPTIARTTHQLAWDQFGDPIKHKLGSMSGAITANALGCNRAVGSAINATLVTYMASADLKIGEQHLPDDFEKFPAARTSAGAVIEGARRMFTKMSDPSDTTSATHDVYLKHWVNSCPVLDYAFIMLDEAQDSNRLIVDLVNRQVNTTRAYVGDPHQAIFEFRGAINLMGTFEVDEMLRMTASFRFGPKIGLLASTFLRHWKNEQHPVRGCGPETMIYPKDTRAYLNRTVARLIENGIILQDRGQRLYWIGKKGLDDYRTQPILEAYDLFKNKKDGRKTDPTLRLMNSWSDFTAYAESGGAGELAPVFKLIERYKGDVPGMLKRLKEKEVKADSVEQAVALGANSIMTTAHKSKGLEFPVVVMDQDFPTLKDRKTGLWLKPSQVDESELNLRYVALTRAIKAVNPDGELKDFFRSQPATAHLMPPAPPKKPDEKDRGFRERAERIEFERPRAA